MLPSVSDLPLVNASLNGVATVLLIVGYVCIRGRRINAHRTAMVAAFVASVLFLVSYLTYHAHAGSRPFPGQGPIRVVYFVIGHTWDIYGQMVVYLRLNGITPPASQRL